MAIHFADASTHDSSQTSPWRGIGVLLFISTLLLSIAPARGQPVAAQSGLFIMSIDADPDSYLGKYFLLLYTEAFKRLGIPFQLDNLALKRQGVQTGVRSSAS